MVYLRLILVYFVSLISACGGGSELEQTDPPAVYLPIANELQQQPNWCWVATSRQIIASLPNGPRQSTPPQCALAASALGASANFCCGNPAACDYPGTLQQQQFLIATFGGRASTISLPADAISLYQTIKNGYAVVLSIRGSGLVGHVVVLRGMFWQNGTPYVVINDPMSYFPNTYPFHQLIQFWQSALIVI